MFKKVNPSFQTHIPPFRVIITHLDPVPLQLSFGNPMQADALRRVPRRCVNPHGSRRKRFLSGGATPEQLLFRK